MLLSLMIGYLRKQMSMVLHLLFFFRQTERTSCVPLPGIFLPTPYFGHSPDKLIATLAFKIHLLIAKG